MNEFYALSETPRRVEVIHLEMRPRSLDERWFDFRWGLYGWHLHRLNDWRRNLG